MLIIQEGDYPKGNQLECEECHCVFKYYNSEIEVDYTDPDESAFLGGFGTHQHIQCPQCNHRITIDIQFTKMDDTVVKNFIKWWNKKFSKEEKDSGKSKRIKNK